MITSAVGETAVGATPLGGGPYFSFLVGNALGQFALGEAPVGGQFSIYNYKSPSTPEEEAIIPFPFIANMLYFMSHRM